MTPFTVDPGFVAEHGRALRADLDADFEHLGRQPAPWRRDRAPGGACAVAARRAAVLGRRHRRHALRPLSRTGRAARRVREARRLRDRPFAGADHARGLAAHPVGQAQGRARAQGARRHARALVRGHELEHLPGPRRPRPLVQVRQPVARGRGRARAGGRAQPGVHRHRPDARLRLDHGLDRRRRELPRPAPLPPHARALPRRPARSTGACRTAGGCSWSTSSRSRRSTRPSSTTGAPATGARRSWGQTRCRWWTWDITRPTSTSR